jgi:DNA-binding XRE family transcriptional regulator
MFDSKKSLTTALCGAMADRETGGPESEVAQRLRMLREMKGISGPKFAEWLDVEYPRWNNWERGYPLPAPIALRLCRRFPGITLDWIYRGRLEGLTVDFASKLDDLTSLKSKTL